MLTAPTQRESIYEIVPMELFFVAGLVVLGSMYLGVPLICILWMRHVALTRRWNIKTDDSYTPSVDVILPTYNEEEVILDKLQNLAMLDYPKDLMKVILVDSGSTDRTLQLATDFTEENTSSRMVVIEEGKRTGKARALNLGLSRSVGEVVVTTDAGDRWEPSVLRSVLRYLADPTVGAVAGVEEVINASQSSATRSEVAYRTAHDYIRLGESKIHSTLILHGGLTAYKRSALGRFDERSGNDEAVAVDLVVKGLRCILIPEARSRYYDYYTWEGKVSRKTTRAWALIDTWVRCLRLAINGEFKLPYSVFISDLYLYLLNPLVGLFFYAFAVFAVLRYPVLLLPLVLLVIFKPTRTYLLAFTSHNLFLLIGILDHLRGTKKHVVWRKVHEGTAALPGKALSSS